MPASARHVTRDDILTPAQFAAERAHRRAELLPIKALRRVEVGPSCTFYFECFETMLFQIQEMLHIEGGGERQIDDELAAYNPLVPRGDELVATIMFEIPEAERRKRVLAQLGGVEACFFVQIGDEKIVGEQETDVERTREDGKASSVHFAHFRLTAAQAAAFKSGAANVLVGVGHVNYAHTSKLSAQARAEIARDLD